MKPKYNTSKLRSQAFGASLITAITFCIAGSATAADIQWSPTATTSDWNTAANWTGGVKPIGVDNAVINVITGQGETVEKHGFAMSTGEWHNDIHAVGVGLKLNDGTGPFALNCGAPAFKFTEDRLKNDIGPRLVSIVRNIEAALNGSMSRRSQIKENADGKKPKTPGGRVARVVEGIG